MKKNRLRESLIEVVTHIRENKKWMNEIKKGMKNYKVLPGQIQSYFNNPDSIWELDIETVFLLLEQIYLTTENPKINPSLFFSVREMKEIKTNFVGYHTHTITFPYTFHRVLKGSNNDFILYIKASEIKLLFENGLLQYNAETQREMRQSKGKESDQIIETPKLIEKSIKDMEELLKKGEMISTIITLNARLGSSDHESGEELIYHEDAMTLTVTEGTLLDVLDGFHRINAIVRALRKDPSLEAIFKLNILNLGKSMAQQYFKQLNTMNPVGKGQLKKLGASRQADFIAKQLQYNSELKNKVAASDRISPHSNFLVTFHTLSDAIDEIFGVEDKITAIKVSEYLIHFINELFYAFPNAFIFKIAAVRKESIINTNTMFYGYFALAKKMKDEQIQLNKLPEIIRNIDFSRQNTIWVDYNILNHSHQITIHAKKQLYKFFIQLDLSKYQEGG